MSRVTHATLTFFIIIRILKLIYIILIFNIISYKLRKFNSLSKNMISDKDAK